VRQSGFRTFLFFFRPEKHVKVTFEWVAWGCGKTAGAVLVNVIQIDTQHLATAFANTLCLVGDIFPQTPKIYIGKFVSHVIFLPS
jgi:hypothetical protein